MTIRYKSGYKYQLDEYYEIQTGITGYSARTSFLSLYKTGRLGIEKGYAWDGSSWSLDNKKSMPASVVHDGLYQLMRMGKMGNLQGAKNRDQADRLFQQMCVHAGMWKWWAWIRYKALVRFGGAASDPENKRPVITAP